MTHRALVVDDEAGIRFVLRGALEDRGFEVEEAETGEEAVARLEAHPPLLAFVDILMPGLDGMGVLERSREVAPATHVILMTAQDTMRNAVEAMKRGAFDYVTKPFDLDEVEVLVDRAVEGWRVRREVERLREAVRDPYLPESSIVGRSAPMQLIFKTIGRLASSDATVLVEGESGTGKELIARAIHFNGTRAGGPFVVVNAAAIPSELLESELFGYRRGAFTGAEDRRTGRFEEADGGTLFLDEIGEMPLGLQAKLLRVLEDRAVQPLGGGPVRKLDVRVVAATNRSLDQEVAAGRFRGDLFYRLNVVRLHVPPLRERPEDVPLLVEHFVRRIGAEVGREVVGPSPDALEALCSLSWPGNVRQLENAIRRAIVLGGGPVLRDVDFPELGRAARTAPSARGADSFEELLRAELAPSVALAERGPLRGQLYRDVIERLERSLIELVLEHTEGNQLKAAELLGINRNTLRKKMRSLDVSLPDAGEDAEAS